MKKLLSAVLILLLLVGSAFTCLVASADSGVVFTVNCSQSDSRLTAIVSTDRNVENISGFYIKLKVPEGLTYVSGSRKILFETNDNADITKDTFKNNTLILGVDVVGSDYIKFGKNVVSYQFDVTSANGNVDFVLEIEELYKMAGNKLTDIPVASNTVTKTVSVTDEIPEQVRNVIDLINRIGAVTVDSGEAISRARTAYNALDILSRKKVSNTEVLFAAETEYAKLTADSDTERLNRLAEEFRTTHSVILSKTVSTLQLSDEALLEKALEDYADCEVNVCILLNSEKNHLNRLKTRIKELKDIENDRITEEQLKKEAKELADEWKQRYKDFIALDKNKVTDQYLTGLVNAIGDADSQSIINSYFLDYAKDEYEHLQELYEAAKAYSGSGTSTNQKMADSFVSSYAYLMHLSQSSISADDEIDVRTALSLYQMLPSEAQALINKLLGTDSVEEQLNALISAIEELPVEIDDLGDNGSDSTVISDTSNSDGKNDTTEVTTTDEEKSGVLVNVTSGGIGKIIWYLLFSSAFSVILVAAAAVMLIILKRKYNNCLKGGDEI